MSCEALQLLCPRATPLELTTCVKSIARRGMGTIGLSQTGISVIAVLSPDDKRDGRNDGNAEALTENQGFRSGLSTSL
jgi:hypothetical protein